MNLFWSKYKKALWVVFAIIFIVAIFFTKNKNLFDNTIKYLKGGQQTGLTYDPHLTIKDLVNQDTDMDGVPDWEERLWGTDPTKKDTISGVPDSVTVEKLRGEKTTISEETNSENLTKTEEFAKELFATATAANQTGQYINSSAIANISNSLAEKIQDPAVRKTFSISDIKINRDNSVRSIQKYKDTLLKIYAKYPTKTNVSDVLKDFVGDGTNINENALQKLDPIIEQLHGILYERIKMDVPDQLSQQHLDVINALEKVIENLTDIKLYNSDPVVTIGALNVYNNNTALLQSSIDTLAKAIEQRLKN